MMARALIVVIAILVAACSADSDPDQQSTNSSSLREAEPPQVVSARDACKHHEQVEMDVGISPYEACLGKRANLTRPADRQLCDLAKSTMSSDGVCILGE